MIRIRNYSHRDFKTLVRLWNELDVHGQTMAEDEMRGFLEHPAFEPLSNIFLLETDGQPAGAGIIRRSWNSAANRHAVHLRLPPGLAADRPSFDLLLVRIEQRLAAIDREYESPMLAWFEVYEDEADVCAALEQHAYRIVGYSSRLCRRDVAGLAQAVLPSGVAIRQLDPETDLETYRAVKNRAFADTVFYWPDDADTLREFFRGPFYQPSLCFVAESGRTVAGYCRGYLPPEPEADGVHWGFVTGLGVLPESRHRGIGRALLRHTMSALRSAGAEGVTLGVDYADPHGAKELYYSEGFTDRHITRCYAREWPAA